jgi:hypothetical protein
VNALRDPNVAHVLLLSLAVLLLLGSLLCLSVGLGLVFRSASVLRLFHVVNRWVSTRRAMKPMEIPRTSDLHVTDRRRRWVTGLFFALGGAYAAYGLGTGVDAARVIAGLKLQGALIPIGFIAVETMRWSLIVLCAGAVALGVILVAYPTAWPRIETRANRWYSTRQLMASGDAMNLSLDHWVERFPKPAGVVVAVLSLVPLAGAVAILFGR